MRHPIAIIIGFIVAVVLAWLGVEIVQEVDSRPDWADEAVWAVALLAWAFWSFGGYLNSRV